jgi:hypothetical protein
MRRIVALLVLVGLLAGLTAMPAAAKKPEAARSQTYYVVPGAGFQCRLSIDAESGRPGAGCDTGYDVATNPSLTSKPTWIPALDGLPLVLDANRTIRGAVTVSTRPLWGYTGEYGAGPSQVRAIVTGFVDGEEVLVGSATSEPYVVVPTQAEYEVEFEIDPDAELAGAALTELTLGLKVVGPNVRHNYFYADGQSTLTIPRAR